ncbi:hypothetical protein [Actinoplanes awajinensis]|uniref:Uncharacterized protein n=1 Tax=Actinoplanes awajinensis subsp. mycoplanecinus TaxID=135947 RepID=A0A101JMG9_9ACTN|nr:hypothetical protein [Actinoplanes awajinensis]KUL29479.1 hypothetical protein ADL15_28100 [Actinoplanes awajinensis subsp. mycoplanecinus]
MTPVLNIIYTRGTVRALARFAPLFTDHTGWRYRLVANGCTAAPLTSSSCCTASPRPTTG